MDFTELVRHDYADRAWIVCAEVAAGATSLIAYLLDNGVEKVMLISGTRGIGDVPEVPTVELGTSGNTIMGGIREFERIVLDLPDAALATIDEFDPSSEALVLFAGFGTPTHIAGRPVFAPRRPEWLALENKITAPHLWSRAGIVSAPHRIVDANALALHDATRHWTRAWGQCGWPTTRRDGTAAASTSGESKHRPMWNRPLCSWRPTQVRCGSCRSSTASLARFTAS